MPYFCQFCNKKLATLFSLRRHTASFHDPKFTGFKCTLCCKSFTTRSYLRRHSIKCGAKIQRGGNLPLGDKQIDPKLADFPNTDVDIRKVYKDNWGAIRTYFKCRQIVDIFNFRLVNQKEDLKNTLTDLWVNKLSSQVKLQASVGLILQHRVTHQYRFYHSSSNNTNLFQSPVTVRSLGDLMEIVDLILEMDLGTKSMNVRPDSSWSFHSVTNISFSLTKTNFPKYGAPPKSIPSHLRRLKSVRTLLTNGSRRYNDNLCFFRALALKQNCTCSHRCFCLSRIESVVLSLFDTYMKSIDGNSSPDTFTGVMLDDLVLMEEIFDLKITVYKSTGPLKAKIIRQSYKKSGNELNLCAFHNHFMLIQSISDFTKCFQCPLCSATFRTKSSSLRHKLSCAKQRTKYSYGKDNFFPPPSIFEEIESFTHIQIPEDLKFYPFRATFDMNATYLNQRPKTLLNYLLNLTMY